jgi:Zn-dependent protease with chaperone function
VRRLALAALAGAAWLGAAWWLWQTSKVPSSLALPHLNEHAFFSAPELRRARSFSRFTELAWLGGALVELAVFAVYARRGARFARESAAGPLGTGMLLGMLGFALLWVAELPFAVLDLWWQRRHGLSHVSYWQAVFGGWASLGGEFLFLCLALAIVMGLARLVGDRWWIPAAPAFGVLALLFAFVSPYLIQTKPLRNPQLQAAVRVLEQRERLRSIPVRVQDVKSTTSLPNSEAMGIGPSRRVVLWDTMLDGRFSEREVRVVIGHELGHVARNHVLKSVGWYMLFAFPGLFLIAVVTRRRGGMTQPEAIPLALLALVVLGLLGSPLENAVSRHMEAEADWLALQTTRDPTAAAGLFREFVPTTLSDPNPPTWDYLLLEDHPTIMQRLAMVAAWRQRYAASSAQLP